MVATCSIVVNADLDACRHPVLVFDHPRCRRRAGGLGSTLGIGGGIFLVPFLTLAMGMPISVAAAISLTTVIANVEYPCRLGERVLT